jgi:hypothetical protein
VLEEGPKNRDNSNRKNPWIRAGEVQEPSDSPLLIYIGVVTPRRLSKPTGPSAHTLQAGSGDGVGGSNGLISNRAIYMTFPHHPARHQGISEFCIQNGCTEYEGTMEVAVYPQGQKARGFRCS